VKINIVPIAKIEINKVDEEDESDLIVKDNLKDDNKLSAKES
jgi:hypothetical protein